MAESQSPKAVAWLRTALRQFLALPSAVTEIEKEPSTSRSAGFDADFRDLVEFYRRGQTGYSDDLIDLPPLSRTRRIQLSRVLYERDARIKDIIRKTSAEVLRQGWTYSVSDTVPDSQASRLEAAMADLTSRLGMMQMVSGWHRAALVDGDLFLQVVMTGRNMVGRVQYLNPLTMQRNSNRHDLFPDPDRAFLEYRDGTLIEDDGIHHELAGLHQKWQGKDGVRHAYDVTEVVHARVDTMPGRRYGRPLLESGLDSIRYARVGEQDLGIRRKRKAAPQDVWTVGNEMESTPPDSVMDDVMDALENRRRNVPIGRELDMTIKYPVSAQHFIGDVSIDRVLDIQHHIDTAYAAGPVPKQASGYMDNINRDVIPAVEKVLASNIESQREWMRSECLVPLMERVLLFEGIPVKPGQVTVTFPPREYALEDFHVMAQSIGLLGRVDMIPRQSAYRLLAQLQPDILDSDDMMQEHAAEEEIKNSRMESAQQALLPDSDDNTEEEDGDPDPDMV